MAEKTNPLVKAMVDQIIAQDEARLKAEEQAYLKLGNQRQFASLHTNDQGSKAADELHRKDQAFYTGFASSCFAAAVTHPDIGIGAAHYNTVTREDLERYVIENLSGKRTTTELMRLMHDPNALLNAMVTPASRIITLEKVVGSAIKQFKTLSHGELPPDSNILVCGGFYVNPNEALQLEATVANLGYNLPIYSKLGTDNGVMYGFPSHPFFKQVGFYNLRSFVPKK